MVFESNKEKGNAGLAIAIAYFGANGYTVSIPLNDTQDYDLIVDKDGIIERVQVKATGNKSKSGAYSCDLRSKGGTNGKQYKTVRDTKIDKLFVFTGDFLMYLIPFNMIKTNTLNLNKTYSKFNNRDKVDWSKYIVTL